MTHSDDAGGYLDFASKVSFFEFSEEIREFNKPDIDPAALREEIKALEQGVWDVQTLATYVRRHPRSFRIFEQLFQNKRFTNAQLIHFTFDVGKLNDPDLRSSYPYAMLNLRNDPELLEIFQKRSAEFLGKASSPDTYGKTELLAVFKMAVSDYILVLSGASKRADIMIQDRITRPEFDDFAVRFAEYLLQNLKLGSFLKGVNIAEYLQSKQIPVDNKTLHGKFATAKLKEVLVGGGYTDADPRLRDRQIRLDDPLIRSLDNHFCTERTVEGVVKPKTGKPKRFDVVTIRNGKPRLLIETNFYTTEGSKIDINENEYRDLFDSIRSNPDYKFVWVTDGNYWLTPHGKERYEVLSKVFGGVYNINTFKENLAHLG